MKCMNEKIPSIALIGMLMHLNEQRIQQLFGKYDLNKSQAGILLILHHGEALSQKEMAKRLNVTPPSITSAIQKMEKSGYITRRLDEKDQRVMRLHLTDKGEECIQGLQEVTKKMDQILFRGMNMEEKLLLRRLMMQMIENLQNEDGYFPGEDF
ncbi:MAG: MarR family transcriptional regulator [Candidatus Ruminococcus intestinipullorum]|nr:MarR family transcriptional regulator [Candidatus Ruminococcus intestinipullorum]